ncbi:ATP-binding protein [Verminephrobacter eiseniae]|nr:ATP-binding protein [Verminephrobacter eiseniae]MCW5294101.1 ATP-binding protein [Verminephrobacter eiseniae]MCW8183160.1 ATP-binding protein [Verminephrobacter eiseniae]MCW8222101.1 ATP-binding protein [Verminephrobacter eiseniae]MCW8232695.1 ATP-binding protein [Verminephrobacter eiseniae]
MRHDPTFIGTVRDVHGSTITVELSNDTVTGLGFVHGKGYRIGQVGSFVRIPLGFVDLYGVVSQVGAGAAPARDQERQVYGNRWVTVQMVGEGQRGGRFERGISQHPTIEDRVHIVIEADLRAIYGSGDPQDFVSVGHLASAESIPSLVNINKLVTRHSAVVGTTGSGKSTTVAGLLNALSDPEQYPSARIIVFDIHGEYSKALVDRAAVFRVAADETRGQQALHVPFWALSFEELSALAFGTLDDGNGAKTAAVADALVQLKKDALKSQPREGIEESQVTADTPIPFCIHKLWFDLHQREHQTVMAKPGGAQDELAPAYALGADGQPMQLGDAMSVTPPAYRTVKTSGMKTEQIHWSQSPPPLALRQQLAGLASKLRDPRLAFLFNPGDWRPDIDGKTGKDLDKLLEDWIGGPKPITILDLSGIPSSILNELIGALLRVLYDAIFWARNLPEGGRERPLLMVLEEAHAYLSKENSGTAAAAVRRIAKEGRKYGVGMMIVSQRPSEIDSTILSQCGTIFAMRLANDTDRGHVTSAASDNLKGLFEMLPVLRTGEAIIVGEAVSLPVRTLIAPPPLDRRPDSIDPRVVERGDLTEGFQGLGGWNQHCDSSDYSVMVRQWRKQSPHYDHIKPMANDNEE